MSGANTAVTVEVLNEQIAALDKWMLAAGTVPEAVISAVVSERARLVRQRDGIARCGYLTQIVDARIVARQQVANITGRYFVVDANGRVINRNEFGKAVRWSFAQLGAADAQAHRSGGRVYDKVANTFL